THSFYATTDGEGNALNNAGVNSGVYTGNEYGSAKTLAELQQLATFEEWGDAISAEGGGESVWRIYEGHTTPLLRSFLTPLELTPDYDGSGAALDNIAQVTLPTGVDTSLIGNWTGVVQGDTLTLTGNAEGGGYTATSNGSGTD